MHLNDSSIRICFEFIKLHQCKLLFFFRYFKNLILRTIHLTNLIDQNHIS